jgi:iron uptake system EfeUOB component EfeO/EfeM
MTAKRMLAILAIVASLILPACAKKPAPQKSPEQTQKKTGGGGGGGNKEKSTKKDPVKDGAKQMRTQLDDLRVAVRAGDGAAAQQSAQALDAKWEKIEGQVREKHPEAYDKIERPLHAVVSGVGVTPFDQNQLGSQIDLLDAQLAQLTKSTNGGGGGGGDKQADMKMGIAAMRYGLQQVEGNLQKDTAAAQKAAKDVDEAWEKVQGAVKKQDKNAYTNIEELMHKLLAAVQATPLDKQKAAEQLPKLDAELQKLGQ